MISMSRTSGLTPSNPRFLLESQGHHPFAYALAELIDNSLRATRDVTLPGQSRTITISFVTSGSASSRKGLICVRDNGSGMSKEALTDWAVMNLSMEDRGQRPIEAEPAGRGQPSLTGAGNFLTGDLSYFGVIQSTITGNSSMLVGTSQSATHVEVHCNLPADNWQLHSGLHCMHNVLGGWRRTSLHRYSVLSSDRLNAAVVHVLCLGIHH